VEGGIDSEVPENAIRVLVGAGLPLCRGTLAEDQGQPDFWLDIGVVTLKEASGRGKCRTLRIKRGAPILQENFYYLVPADTEGEVSTEGMVSADEVQAAVAEATAHLEADLQAAHDQTQGMVSADEVHAAVAEATAHLEADLQAAHDQTQGMVSADEVQAAVAEATAHLEADLQAAHDQTQGMVSTDEVQAAVAEATAHLEAELQAAHEQKLADEVELGKAEDLYSLKMQVRKFCEMYLDHPNAINPEEDEYTFVQSNMTQITWCNGLNLGD
jgi:hypothetical protein